MRINIPKCEDGITVLFVTQASGWKMGNTYFPGQEIVCRAPNGQHTYTPAGQKSYDTYRQSSFKWATHTHKYSRPKSQPSFKWATNSQQMAGPIHHPHCFLKKHVFQYLFTISHLSHSFLDEENETALFVSTSSPPRKEKVCFRVLNLPARSPHNVLRVLNLPIMSCSEY